MPMRNLISALGALAMMNGAAAAADCNMHVGFAQPDDNGKSTTAVWEGDGGGVLFADVLHVNTDGTKRSYSVDDFWGQKTALNNLCNAMSDGCAGLSNAGLTARRILTQKARADHWPKAEFAATRISSAIIPLTSAGAPCPEKDGYLVSATALHRRQVNDVCDISNYVDALTIPAVVIPGGPDFGNLNAAVGDLAVVVPRNGSSPIFAVVGDIGPRKEIGEADIALAGALLGKTAEPANYEEIRGKGIYRGKGWDAFGVVLIFPGSRSAQDPYLTTDRIDAAAAPLFQRWGGVDRLVACRSVYRQH